MAGRQKALTDFCLMMQIGKRQLRQSLDPRGLGWKSAAALLANVGPVIIASGPASDEADEATWLCGRLGPGAMATLGRADWPQMAGLLRRARFYVGTDTATMHLAAACGCPVVALFGSTWEGNWRPWRSPHRIVTESDAPPSGDLVEDLARAKQRTMAGISPAKVITACAEFMK